MAGPAAHRRRRRASGRSGRLGRSGRRAARGRTGAGRWTRPAPAWCRGSSTRTRTCCSPACGARSSSPGWPARRTTAAASGPQSRPPRPRPTTSCSSSPLAGWPLPMPTAPPRWRSSRDTASPSTPSCGCCELVGELARRTPVRLEATYLGAHVVPAGRDRDDYVDEVVDDPATGGGGRRPVGRRLLRPGRLHRRGGPADPHGRPGARVLACGCTPRRSPGPAPQRWRPSWAAPARTTWST